jgi:large subunit ribosomal protein L10
MDAIHSRCSFLSHLPQSIAHRSGSGAKHRGVDLRGVLADKTLDEKQFKALATLPSKEVLLSQLLSVLQAPIQQLLGVLQAPARDLVMVLKAYENKKSGQS